MQAKLTLSLDRLEASSSCRWVAPYGVALRRGTSIGSVCLEEMSCFGLPAPRASDTRVLETVDQRDGPVKCHSSSESAIPASPRLYARLHLSLLIGLAFGCVGCGSNEVWMWVDNAAMRRQGGIQRQPNF